MTRQAVAIPTVRTASTGTAHPPLTPAALHKLLAYDETTGILTWRTRPVDMFTGGLQSAAHSCAAWNAKHAGRPALATKTGNGYLAGNILNRHHLAHRVIWALVHGQWPEQVDHINGIGADNRQANLRAVTHAENMRNKRTPSNNTSGVIGVHWHSRERMWVARIKIDRREEHLGLFRDFEDAAKARKLAEQRHAFHENHGRD